MKNITFIAFLLICVSVNSQSWRRNTQKVDLTIGYVQDGFGIYGSYNRILFPQQKLKVDLGFSQSILREDLIDTKLNIFLLSAQYLKEVYSSRREGFSLNIGGGPIFGYENVAIAKSFSPAVVPIAESKIIYGFTVGAEGDFYLARKHSIIATINEQWHINSDVGNFIPYFGIGYRYTL